MLKKYELTDKDFFELHKYASKLNIDFISTAADKISLQFLHYKLKLKTIKIGSSDLTNIQLLINAGRTKRNIIISCGLATIENIDIALSALCYGYAKKDFHFNYKKNKEFYLQHEEYLRKKITLLHCTTEYPAPLEELNLSVRAYNCLKRAQVNSVSDLMGFSYEDLLEIKNFGSKSADEVIEALERIGISIPQSRTSA